MKLAEPGVIPEVNPEPPGEADQRAGVAGGSQVHLRSRLLLVVDGDLIVEGRKLKGDAWFDAGLRPPSSSKPGSTRSAVKSSNAYVKKCEGGTLMGLRAPDASE
jgi:hypothetical protein